jgi:hypothetical protein
MISCKVNELPSKGRAAFQIVAAGQGSSLLRSFTAQKPKNNATILKGI